MGLFDRFRARPTQDQFAGMMMDALRRDGVEGPIRYDAQDYRLVLDGERMFQLDNAYADYVAAPRRERKACFRQYVHIAANPLPEPPKSFHEAKASILPRVRDRFFYEAMRLQFRMDETGPFEIPTRPVAEHLAVELACDFPEAVMSVTQEHLDTWGVSFDEAMQVARDNLWQISNEPFTQPVPGLYASPWQDSHDASRLVLHDLIWQLDVKGDHVAMVSHRDVLLVTGSEDVEGLRRMAAAAETALKDSRALTGVPVRLNGSDWEPFLPTPEHAAYLPLKNLYVQTVASEYGQQKELLDAIHEKQDEDVFVANVMVVEDKPSGLLETVAVWSKGGVSLLPRVERVAFLDPEAGETPTIAEWDAACEVAGDLMQPAGLYPERYRVSGFPDADALVGIAIEDLEP